MALVVAPSIDGTATTAAAAIAPAAATSPTGHQRKHRTGDPRDHRKHPQHTDATQGGDASSDGTSQGHAYGMKTKVRKVMTMKPAGFKYPPLLNESPIDWLYGDNMAEFANAKTYTK